MSKEYKMKTRCLNCNHTETWNIPFGRELDECPPGIFIYTEEEGIRTFYDSQGKEETKAHYLICTNCGGKRLKKEFENKKAPGELN